MLHIVGNWLQKAKQCLLLLKKETFEIKKTKTNHILIITCILSIVYHHFYIRLVSVVIGRLGVLRKEVIGKK